MPVPVDVNEIISHFVISLSDKLARDNQNHTRKSVLCYLKMLSHTVIRPALSCTQLEVERSHCLAYRMSIVQKDLRSVHRRIRLRKGMIIIAAFVRILRSGIRTATFLPGLPQASHSTKQLFGNRSFSNQSHDCNMDNSAQSERTVTRRVITSPKSPAAIGPYSSAILANDTLYISGQLGIDASKGADLVSGGAEKEAEQALVNMGYILNAAGADYHNVVKTTVLLADISDFQAVNQVYAKFFTHNPPARAAYQAAALPKNARVEIEAIAIIGTIKNE